MTYGYSVAPFRRTMGGGHLRWGELVMSGLESPELRLATRVLRAVPFGNPLSPCDDASDPRVMIDRSSASGFPTVTKADIARDDLTGLSLGQYALGTKIGGGGMGKVFRARHTRLDRIFAIKFMAADLSGQSEAQDRFEQETLALGKLQHPQIVNAIDAGCVDGLKYLVTEFVEGEDLAKLVQRRGRIAPQPACDLIRQAAMGLAYSHAAGFVHRDIKPSNLIVDHAGVLKILDFGLVRSSRRDHQLTDNGEFLGTWDFLAPEQAQDASQVDCRSDIYSLGCTLLYLLSGDVPFSNSTYATPAAKLKAHLFDTPAWLKNHPPQIPMGLIKVLTRMLAKSPSKRFQTANDVATALIPFTSDFNEQNSGETYLAARETRSGFRFRLRRWPFAFGLLGVLAWFTSFQIQIGGGVIRGDQPFPAPMIPAPNAQANGGAPRIQPGDASVANSNKPLLTPWSKNSAGSGPEIRPANHAGPRIVPLSKQRGRGVPPNGSGEPAFGISISTW